MVKERPVYSSNQWRRISNDRVPIQLDSYSWYIIPLVDSFSVFNVPVWKNALFHVRDVARWFVSNCMAWLMTSHKNIPILFSTAHPKATHQCILTLLHRIVFSCHFSPNAYGIRSQIIWYPFIINIDLRVRLQLFRCSINTKFRISVYFLLSFFPYTH